jgi:hypothetical protein
MESKFKFKIKLVMRWSGVKLKWGESGEAAEAEKSWHDNLGSHESLTCNFNFNFTSTSTYSCSFVHILLYTLEKVEDNYVMEKLFGSLDALS